MNTKHKHFGDLPDYLSEEVQINVVKILELLGLSRPGLPARSFPIAMMTLQVTIVHIIETSAIDPCDMLNQLITVLQKNMEELKAKIGHSDRS